jgi:hypothetical protein
MAEPRDIGRLFAEGTAIDRAIARAAAAARREYVRLGRPMPVWQDGRLVWLPPERIPLDAQHDDGRTMASSG